VDKNSTLTQVSRCSASKCQEVEGLIPEMALALACHNGKDKKGKLAPVPNYETLHEHTCLTKHHAMKTYWGMEVLLHPFLTSALDGGEGEWSA